MNKDDAKQIFFNHECSHYFMEIGGVRERYKSFGITTEEECAWRNERMYELLGKVGDKGLMSEHLGICMGLVRESLDRGMFENFLDFIVKQSWDTDTFTLLGPIGGLLDIIDAFHREGFGNSISVQRARDVTSQMLDLACKGDITVNSCYSRFNVTGVTSENAIKTRLASFKSRLKENVSAL